jgi:hypothetical protein
MSLNWPQKCYTRNTEEFEPPRCLGITARIAPIPCDANLAAGSLSGGHERKNAFLSS